MWFQSHMYCWGINDVGHTEDSRTLKLECSVSFSGFVITIGQDQTTSCRNFMHGGRGNHSTLAWSVACGFNTLPWASVEPSVVRGIERGASNWQWNWPASKRTSQSASRPANQSASLPVGQPVSQPASRPVANQSFAFELSFPFFPFLICWTFNTFDILNYS